MTANTHKSNLVLVRNIFIAIGTGALIAYTNFHVETGYYAMSAIALSSFLIGFLEPRRGWILALVQATVVISFYYLKPIKPVSEDLAMFASYVAVVMSLVFSFVAGGLGRLFQKK
ncbi:MULTISPECIES: hypothetical protein [Emticicia]|uniref:hypothetical protein n=1 Tax=Emticicia TaxID=312278 RepID=UPI000C78361B|nr:MULTISPECIES: hypothetical protein [Emticicia]PLK44104.1 hypothetical protein C0V77_13235 [Emticicia sp. TH156]UTA68591.1 hypothetical protein MB380_02010 [Emticicia sp. 21SJ11W-3]